MSCFHASSVTCALTCYCQLVYLVSITLFTVGSAIVAISNTIGLLIGMRMVRAAG
jgi:hypothetical protein